MSDPSAGDEGRWNKDNVLLCNEAASAHLDSAMVLKVLFGWCSSTCNMCWVVYKGVHFCSIEIAFKEAVDNYLSEYFAGSRFMRWLN